MAITLLTAVQRVCRNVGLDPTITSFSDTDETNDIVQDIAEAYEDLLSQLPEETAFIYASGAITTSASTRTYALASDAMVFDLYDWSFNDQTNNYNRILPATREYIENLDPQWRTYSGKPQYVYPEGNNTVGFYPVPDATDTINYQYGKTVTTRISATTDTFIIPDRWVRYLVKRAQAKYERRKMFAEPDATDAEAMLVWYQIIAEAWETAGSSLLEEGF